MDYHPLYAIHIGCQSVVKLSQGISVPLRGLHERFEPFESTRALQESQKRTPRTGVGGV